MADGKGQTGKHGATRTHCGFDETLKGERCELPGGVRLMGLLLCQKHARQMEIEDCVASLQGITNLLELCMSNVSIRRNAVFTRLLRSQRAEVAVKLEYAHQQLRENAG